MSRGLCRNGSEWCRDSDLCGPCHDAAVIRYPQGWRHYPGDICPHGMYTGGCGVDWICGMCEEGLCRHGNKVSGFSWEDTEGCGECGVAPIPRIFESFEASARQAQASAMVRGNLTWAGAVYTRDALMRNFGMGQEEAETFIRECPE